MWYAQQLVRVVQASDDLPPSFRLQKPPCVPWVADATKSSCGLGRTPFQVNWLLYSARKPPVLHLIILCATVLHSRPERIFICLENTLLTPHTTRPASPRRTQIVPTSQPSIEGGQIFHINFKEVMLQGGRMRMNQSGANQAGDPMGMLGSNNSPTVLDQVDRYITLYRLITFTTHASRWKIFLFPTRILRS